MDMESVCNECHDCECNKYSEPVTLNARVLRVCCCELLVCDLCTSQELLVHTNSACCFCPGQCVCITYDGIATMSIPPQINADRVELLNNGCCC